MSPGKEPDLWPPNQTPHHERTPILSPRLIRLKLLRNPQGARPLMTKLGKLATELGVGALGQLGYPSKAAFTGAKLDVLRTCT